VHEYKIVEEIRNEESDTWSYHLSPTSQEGWQWGSKTDRISVSLIPIHIGHFWTNDEVASWSILIQWIR
jgi:hypothetical protein